MAGDFYAAKGLVEAVGAAARLELAFAAPKDAPPFLHPGRSAVVHAGVVELGWIGELHPLIARAWDLEGGAAFELDFDAMAAATPQIEQFTDVTSFPAVRQDLAVVAPAEVEAAAIRAVVLEAGGELLAGAEVFDVYEGEQVGEGNRSLALRLEFRAPDRTLTDEEVAAPRSAIEAALTADGRVPPCIGSPSSGPPATAARWAPGSCSAIRAWS